MSMFCFLAHFTFSVGCSCAVLLLLCRAAEEHVGDHINAVQVVIYVSFSWMDLIFVFEVGSWEHSSFD